ncbi:MULTISPECIES: hypothetical protein [Candidatus Ichthyocystis]|uniref:hypothetical protein n=1 Tax=Candidatus Ichthyocystis TaxID=2929841 RepID=UPI000B817F37|nr:MULTISPECIES: hypothetical protein [Ichthyocystis]
MKKYSLILLSVISSAVIAGGIRWDSVGTTALVERTTSGSLAPSSYDRMGANGLLRNVDKASDTSAAFANKGKGRGKASGDCYKCHKCKDNCSSVCSKCKKSNKDGGVSKRRKTM